MQDIWSSQRHFFQDPATADDDNFAGQRIVFEDDFALGFEFLEDIGDDADAGDIACTTDLAPGGRVAVVELLVSDDEVEDVFVIVDVWGAGHCRKLAN